MFGKSPRVNPLESRRQLLVAESELNRVQLLKEWQTMAEGVSGLADRARSIGSFASAAALGLAGLAAFRRSKPVSAVKKPSWVETVLRGVRLAASIWLAFRAHGSNSSTKNKTNP
jgi:hypothetical protein